MVIANQMKSHLETLSAVLDDNAELCSVIEKALVRRKLYHKKTILFMKDVRAALDWAPQPMHRFRSLERGVIKP